jgi:hypothetical protein
MEQTRGVLIRATTSLLAFKFQTWQARDLATFENEIVKQLTGSTYFAENYCATGSTRNLLPLTVMTWRWDCLGG